MQSDNIQLKSIRRLIVALTATGLLNIVLISLLFYWLVKDSPPPSYFEQRPLLKQEEQAPLANEKGNAEWIHFFRSLSFDQLISRLDNKQLIESGFTQRDIALACLEAFHHFDLSRALLGQPQPDQKRSLVYGQLRSGKSASLIVYPGLSDQQFQAIVDFAKTERWPLTSKGLFWQLKKLGPQEDLSLTDAFSMTPEFLSIELLFNRADYTVSKMELQKMLLDGTWAMLSDFTEQQKKAQDLSPARRQSLLIEYIDHQSKSASYLILKVEGEFALKKLDDRHVIEMLKLMTFKTPESEKFAIDLLTSLRSDSVWQMAATKLFQYAGEAVPEKNLHHMAMTRFVPGQAVVKVTKTIQNPKPNPVKATQATQKTKVVATKPISPQPKKKDRLYIVQDGDSLWKISKKYKVSIDALREYNKLKNDALKPGFPLRIP